MVECGRDKLEPVPGAKLTDSAKHLLLAVCLALPPLAPLPLPLGHLPLDDRAKVGGPRQVVVNEELLPPFKVTLFERPARVRISPLGKEGLARLDERGKLELCLQEVFEHLGVGLDAAPSPVRVLQEGLFNGNVGRHLAADRVLQTLGELVESAGRVRSGLSLHRGKAAPSSKDAARERIGGEDVRVVGKRLEALALDKW